jgi:hypothetical protein
MTGTMWTESFGAASRSAMDVYESVMGPSMFTVAGRIESQLESNIALARRP